MATHDFTSALAQLLQDGELRDLFRRDPQAAADRLRLDPENRKVIVGLSASNLEAQAEVLLRKRFEQVLAFAPETCAKLPEGGWHEFRAYARFNWPGEGGGGAVDARDFSRNLLANGKPIFAPEFVRLEFLCGNAPFAVRFINGYPANGKPRAALQIFLRRRNGWREWVFVFRL